MYSYFLQHVEKKIPGFYILCKKHARIIKYIISGGTGAVVDLGLLFLLVSVWGLWYISGAVLAFLVAFCFSFTLQKFWTFGSNSFDRLHMQAGLYLLVSLLNLVLNTFLIYIFVEYFNIHYFLSQIIAGVLLAVSSFFIYKTFIFSRTSSNAKLSRP